MDFGEVGVVVRVAGELVAPAGDEAVDLFLEDAVLAGRFEVAEDRVRLIDDPQAAATQLEAHVDVVVVQREGGVEAADGFVVALADEDAGSGHGGVVADEQVAVPVAGVVAGGGVEVVQRDAVDEGHAGMLEAAIFEEQLCPDRADFRPLAEFEHRLDPVRRLDFGVVVEEDDVFAGRLLRSEIHLHGEVERLGEWNADDAE